MSAPFLANLDTLRKLAGEPLVTWPQGVAGYPMTERIRPAVPRLRAFIALGTAEPDTVRFAGLELTDQRELGGDRHLAEMWYRYERIPALWQESDHPDEDGVTLSVFRRKAYASTIVPAIGMSAGGTDAGTGAAATAAILTGSGATAVPTIHATGAAATATIQAATPATATAAIGAPATATAVLGTNATATATVTPDGSGAAGTVVIDGSNLVVSITVDNGGSGYVTAPLVTITGLVNGTGAAAVANLSGDAVDSITITNPGNGDYDMGATVSFTALGSVTALTITNGGSGYLTPPTVTITESGGGAGTGATATATLTAGVVTALTITDGGSGYLFAAVSLTPAPSVSSLTITAAGTGYTFTPTVTLTGGGGTGATAVATITDGALTALTVTAAGTGYATPPTVSIVRPGVTSLTITAGGSGYTSEPTVTITGGGGTGATALATLTGGVVTSLTVTTSGSSYTSAPTVSIAQEPSLTLLTLTAGGVGYYSGTTVSFSGGGGSGMAATATVTDGVVTALTVTNAGSGYSSAPTVSFSGAASVGSIQVTNGGSGYYTAPTITITGAGTGATATATVAEGTITAITVTAPGTGYTATPTVTITPAGTGGVGSVTVTAGGTNYLVPPTVTISGSGTGATATAVVLGGIVTAILVTSAGTGYTSATVAFAASALTLYSRLSMEPDGQSTLFATAVREVRTVPGPPIYTERTDEDGAVISIARTLRQASTFEAAETAGGLWTRTRKEPMNLVVAHEVTETRTLPGTAIPTTRTDEDSMTVNVSRRLKVATTIVTGAQVSGGTLTITRREPVTAKVAHEVIETRPLPGNVLTTYTKDGETMTSVQVDVQLVAKPAAPYTQVAGTQIEYHPISNVHGRKVSTTLLNPSGIRRTESGSQAYPFPTLIFSVSGTLVEALDGNTRASMNWQRRNGRSRQSDTITTYTYGTTAAQDSIFSPELKDLIYDGVLFPGANERGVLNNALSITFSTGSSNEKWGAKVETMAFAASTLSASAYAALIGSYRVIHSEVVPWKYNLVRKASTSIRLL